MAQQASLQPRQEVHDYGIVPLHSLCPLLTLDNLQKLHAQLLSSSTCSTSSGEKLTTGQQVQSTLDLSATQLHILCGVLAPLSLCLPDGTPPPTAPPDTPGAGSPLLSVHELSMFLLAQLFSREAQRPDNVEVWPEAGPGLTPLTLPDNINTCTSPTKAGTLQRTPSGKTMLRQQLQQHLRNQAHAMRSFGDHLRRNLSVVAELACSNPPPPRRPSSYGSLSSSQQLQQQPGAPQVCMTAAEVDRMQFLIQPTKPQQGTPLSALIPGLSSGGSVPLDVVASALRALWVEDAPSAGGLGSPRFSSPGTTHLQHHPFGGPNSSGGTGSPSPKTVRSLGQVDDSTICGMHKGTVVRGENDIPGGMLRISDCHDAVLYVLTPLQCVHISGCSDCIIVIGACGRILRMDQCDKVQLLAASSRVLVSCSHNCTLYLGTTSPPMLIGDCRFLRLAPFNAQYERQMAHVRSVGLRLDLPNRWDSPLVLAGRERKNSNSNGTPDSPQPGGSGKGVASMYSLLPPEDFLPFVVPFQGGGGVLAGGSAPPHSTAWRHLAPAIARSSAALNASTTQLPPGSALYLFPLPAEYERVLLRKLAMTGELRQRFRQVGLNKEKERELNDTIQSHFKEWLSSSNLLRQIYDLSNLEKEESNATCGGQTPPPKERTTLNL